MTRTVNPHWKQIRPVRLVAGSLATLAGWDLYSLSSPDPLSPVHGLAHLGTLVRSVLVIPEPGTQRIFGELLILFGFLLITTGLAGAPRIESRSKED
jgi:hypothetical protein